MKYLNIVFCVFIMASCAPSQNSFAPSQITEETIHSLEIDGSAKHSLSFIDISIFSVLSLSLLGFGGQRAYKEFALIREADSLLQRIGNYTANNSSGSVETAAHLLQQTKELSMRMEDWLVFPIVSPALGQRLSQLNHPELALLKETDSLLEQLEHYEAQVPSERVAAEKERLLQHKKELSTHLEELGSFPIAQHKLALLDKHHQLPNGLDAKHAYFAQMRYQIANHFLKERQQFRRLRWQRHDVKTKSGACMDAMNAMADLQQKVSDAIKLNDWDAAFSLLEQANSTFEEGPFIALSKQEFLAMPQPVKSSWIKQANKMLTLSTLQKIQSCQQLVQEMLSVQEEITPLANAINADKDKYVHAKETEVVTHFGLKNSVSTPVALDILETWVGDQAEQQGLQDLSLQGPDGGHAILIATDPIHNRYRLFDPNTGIYLWESKEQFVKDVYAYLVRIGLKIPNKNDALLNRDLDLRPYLEVSFSQSSAQGDVEEHSKIGGGICLALSLQVAQYLLQHPSTETLTLDKLHLQGIYTPAYFEEQIAYYKSMGMPEKELAMINYWFESQSTIPFETDADKDAREIYENIAISYEVLIKKYISKWKEWKDTTITEEEFLKVVDPKDMRSYAERKHNVIRFHAKKNDLHYARLARMLELSISIFDKYRNFRKETLPDGTIKLVPDGTWKDTQLLQIFSWLYARKNRHFYPKPEDGKEKETYNTLKTAQLTLN